MSKHVVVLGGSGFVGKHVVRLAEAAGYRVTVASRRTGCDLSDLDGITKVLSGLQPDAIIHCAAHVGSLHYVSRRAAEVVHDNLQMALNLYRAVQCVCPEALVINPLSNCSYPGAPLVQKEAEWRDGPVHDSVLAYADPKRMLYTIAQCYRAQYGIRTSNWLVANSYGPGDYADPDRVHALNGIIIRLIRAKRAGETSFEIWGTGKPVREWCYVEDVARMLVRSLEGPEQLYPVNLAQNKGYSIAEIAAMAAQAMGYHVEFTFNTSFPDGAPLKILDDQVFRTRWAEFRFTPIEEGIRRTIAYYEEVLE